MTAPSQEVLIEPNIGQATEIAAIDADILQFAIGHAF